MFSENILQISTSVPLLLVRILELATKELPGLTRVNVYLVIPDSTVKQVGYFNAFPLKTTLSDIQSYIEVYFLDFFNKFYKIVAKKVFLKFQILKFLLSFPSFSIVKH